MIPHWAASHASPTIINESEQAGKQGSNQVCKPFTALLLHSQESGKQHAASRFSGGKPWARSAENTAGGKGGQEVLPTITC